MNNQPDMLSHDDEMSALVPWYVSGRISDVDRARVEAHAADNPAFQNEIALAREEADAVFGINQEIVAPAGGLERLRNSVAATPHARIRRASTSLIDRFGAWLGDLAPRQLAYGSIAAALAIAIQAGLGLLSTTLPTQPTTVGYETASAPEAGAGAAHAIVAFKADAPANAISAALLAANAQIVDGPRGGGIYRVRFTGDNLDAADIETLIGKLKARDDVVAMVSRARAD